MDKRTSEHLEKMSKMNLDHKVELLLDKQIVFLETLVDGKKEEISALKEELRVEKAFNEGIRYLCDYWLNEAVDRGSAIIKYNKLPLYKRIFKKVELLPWNTQ